MELYHSILTVIAACIIFANAYAMSLFMRNQNLMSKTNLLLLSLALSEFMTGAVNIPLMVYAETTNAKHANEARTFLITADISTILCAAITMITLCGIIVDRYLVICFPLKYYGFVTKRKTVVFIIISWIFPLCVSFIRLQWLGPVLSLNMQRVNITEAMLIMKVAVKCDKYYYIVGTSIYLVIIAALFTLFVLMFAAIRKMGKFARQFTGPGDESALTTKKREKKAVILFAIMYTAFILCWTPLVVFRLMASAFPINYHKIPVTAVHALIIMKYLTSVLNPVLYILYKYEFYQDFREDTKVLKNVWNLVVHGSKEQDRSKQKTSDATFLTSFASSPGTQRMKRIHGNGYHEHISNDMANV